ncbi:MAG: 50S ribosomal protein L17 [Candidatus Yanofskybacteria bacterium]|nr:50S ribosomal protein L17 [Candidatus Yanofskybacteria bacterium]
MKRGSNRLFGREFQQRKAFLKALLTALVSHGKIRTTVARAKSIRPAAEKLVTQAKRGTLASRRLLLRSVGTKAAATLAKDIAPKFASRAGGYTRIVKLGQRASDGSPMAVIEFVQ